jgi:hypothetical protein
VLGSRFILKHAPICLLAFIIGGSVFAQAIGPPAGMTTDCALDGPTAFFFNHAVQEVRDEDLRVHSLYCRLCSALSVGSLAPSRGRADGSRACRFRLECRLPVCRAPLAKPLSSDSIYRRSGGRISPFSTQEVV